MKKIALILVAVMLFLSLSSCEVINGFINPDGGESGGNVTPGTDEGGENEGTEPETPDQPGKDETDPENPETDTPGENVGTEDPENPGTDTPENPGENPGKENLPSSTVAVTAVRGLNEQIYICLTPDAAFSYRVSYKLTSEKEYTPLDENLMIASEGKLECYVLGIAAGNYDIKIEAESETAIATKQYSEIEVAAQDRSGYAHFGYGEGIGAYNNDGTVKDGATVLYVTNENKNTITMTINGTEYVGLVDIMQKLYQHDAPVLIRVIGKITTNQWSYKNVEPRLADGSNDDPTFFDNSFSTEYGENLVGLKVRYSDKKDGKTYTYRTTADGLGEVRVSGTGISTTTYKGSDFSALKGKTVYDDDSFINVIEVQAAKNITIEGVGTDAEFFQFGVGFEECQSIEVKNLTFTNYPEDALNFMVGSDKGVSAYGNYWVHGNTFNKGYNAWDITGERDKYAGDGSIDMAFVHNVSVAYNYFNECKKTMLVGNSDSSRCMNISIHHNYFNKVGSRIPLARNTNVHSFNNYFNGCSTCASVRGGTYLFSEANYYQNCSKPISIDGGVGKSYGDIFVNSSKGSATIATTRDQQVSNTCKPDATTDYSKFDTDPTLFYYNAELGTTIATHLLDAADVPDFVLKYAGAGVMVRLP